MSWFRRRLDRYLRPHFDRLERGLAGNRAPPADVAASVELSAAARRLEAKLDHAVHRVNEFQHAATVAEGEARSLAERSLFLSGQIAAHHVRLLDRLGSLADAEFRVHSQFGEDGIIEWLVSRLPDIPRVFIEFGVEDYEEANTRFLARNRAWRGLVMDGSAARMERYRRSPFHEMHDVIGAQAFVTAENADDLFAEHGIAGDIGLLSIDIDGNDYWVLKAIQSISPAILVVEYNALMGDLHAMTIPYEAQFERFRAHHSGRYFGASLPALRKLAERKGYRFVGTTSTGVNAFFVRDDLADPVVEALGSVRAWPSRFHDTRDEAGGSAGLRGPGQIDPVAHLPVVDIETGAIRSIADLGPLHSPEMAKAYG